MAEYDERYAALGDFDEFFANIVRREGRPAARRWYWAQVLGSLFPYALSAAGWRMIMLRNYLKSAFRNLGRKKGYALITIGGLAVAMAVCFLTVVWAQYEVSFDRFHSRIEDLYRFVIDERTETERQVYPAAPVPLAAILRDSFPEVRSVAIVQYAGPTVRLASSKTIDFKSSVYLTDPSFLEMFDFPLTEGDRRTALGDVGSIVLTESTARKFFGEDDPMGQTLLALDDKIPMKVTGILRDIPETSHLRFDVLTPSSSSRLWWDRENKYKIFEDWRFRDAMYLLLTPGTDRSAFEAKVAAVVKERAPRSMDFSLSLQPLKDIHLRSDFTVPFFQDDELAGGKIHLRGIRTFLLVSLAVLLTACINSTNLATARSLRRAREIGIRKTNGALRRDIVRQFLGESLVQAFVAFIAAAALAWLLFPVLRSLTGRTFDLRLLALGRLLLSLTGIVLLTGIASGAYPALFVSAFAPVKALKKSFRPDRRTFVNFRRALVAVQIVCSATLIVVTSIFILQLRYLRTKDLGFDRRNLVTFPLMMRKQFDGFKAELLRNPSILGVAAGFSPTLGTDGHVKEKSELSWEGKSAGTEVAMDWIFVDEDYARTYGLEIAQGRFFSKDFPGDKKAFVINESAARAMGLKDPVGKLFSWGNERKGEIIGIIKDFHTGTLKAKIGPMFFVCSPNIEVTVRIDPRRRTEALQAVAATWSKFVPHRPFEYRFLEEALDEMYRDDRRSGRIISLFGFLSISISCLGLFGLVAFMAEQRTKEIGIRKVLGASAGRIVRLMSAEFAALVGIAVVIAWPIGHYLAGQWLGGFAYKIRLSWWIFAGSGLLILTLTLLTTGLRAVMAARADPVQSLRYE